MKSKTFNMSFPAALVAEIDEQAAAEYMTRNEYIRRATVEKLREDQQIHGPLTEKALEKARKEKFKRLVEHDLALQNSLTEVQ